MPYRQFTDPNKLIGSKRTQYRIFNDDILAYWPMADAVGTTNALEKIAGTSGVTNLLTFGSAGIGDGLTAAQWAAATSRMRVEASASRFNMAEGTLLMWLKADANLWTETGTDRVLWRGLIDASNEVLIKKAGAAANTINYVYKAGGTTVTLNYPKFSHYGWFLAAFTWSKSNNRIRIIIDGVNVAEATGLGTWAGSTFVSSACVIGNQSTSASNPWKGTLAHAAFIGREATPAELRALTDSAHTGTKYLSVIGDSISANTGAWPLGTYYAWNGGNADLINHAVGGNSIVASMATQVAAAATDNADVIILQLGVNDDNAGDMAALQVIVQTAINTLRTSNPRATLYYMNILPCWTDSSGTTPIDKSNIRTAIAEACASRNITCWDTFTTPWIDASDTSDGVHPTAPAGFAKVTTQVLAQLG